MKFIIKRKLFLFSLNLKGKDKYFRIFNRGLLKGDKLLATGLIKLQPLENTSTIHDAFDVSFIMYFIQELFFRIFYIFLNKKLFDGRRQLGAKLEVKIRIREPLLHKEVKTLEQRWLIIDKFNNVSKIAL